MARSTTPRNASFAIEDLPITTALLLLFPLVPKERFATQGAGASASSKTNSQQASSAEARERDLPAQPLPSRGRSLRHPLPQPDQLRG